MNINFLDAIEYKYNTIWVFFYGFISFSIIKKVQTLNIYLKNASFEINNKEYAYVELHRFFFVGRYRYHVFL